jgi:hypothetical protein
LNLKLVNLLIYGYESQPIAVSITPEDTALSILTKCGLDGCCLLRNSEPHRYYDNSDSPYADLANHETLYAVLPSGD